MLAALRRAGARVTTLSVDRAPIAAGHRALRPDIAIIDTIAAPSAGPLVRALRANGARVATLALMSRGAVPLARASDRVIAVSHALAHELRAAGIPRARIVVIEPGTKRPTGRRATASGGPRSGVGLVRVLCVANWTPAKGIHTLLAAARRVPEIRLDVVGAPVDTAYAQRVRREVAGQQLAGRVRVHGVVTGARLETLYRAAAIFALPSTLESYGMALGDALAHGLPAIACDIPATREVTRGAALLVPPRSVMALATALRSLATGERERDRLSRRASARARALPTWERAEGQLTREVLGSVPRTPRVARRTSSDAPRGLRLGTGAGSRSSRSR